MKLAFIGLGAIGQPMSERLIDNGYHLNLYKRNKPNNDSYLRYFFVENRYFFVFFANSYFC